MTETTTLWIMGALMTAFAGWLAWLTGISRSTEQSVNVLGNRVNRLEMILVMISEHAAKMLHAHDDYLGLDKYIDKYLDRNYELSPTEWQELLVRFEAVMNTEDLPKDIRMAASFVFHICRHKLMLPPDRTKQIK